jgi:ATP-dependent Clp protease, protease subunit
MVDQILERIGRDTDRDFILSAEQALEYGLVDEILTGRRVATLTQALRALDGERRANRVTFPAP